jgi:hypothetical protein
MKQRAHAFLALPFRLSPAPPTAAHVVRLFPANRRLHDEACAEFTLRVDCLQVGKLAAFRNVAAESE